VYEPEKMNSSYGQFIIAVKSFADIPRVSQEAKDLVMKRNPDTEPKIRFIRLGPGGGAKIEIRFYGPDPEVLRKLSAEAQAIMKKNPRTMDVRDDWRQKVKVIVPVISEAQSRWTGITRQDISDALETAFSGKTVGYFREKDQLIPIVSRPPDEERLDITNIDDLQVWSPSLNRTVPLGQVVKRIDTKWENAIIRRRYRKMRITVSCEPVSGPASVVFNQLKPKLDSIKLPIGYETDYGGEHENSVNAQQGLAQVLPLSFLAMIIVVIALFSAVRQPLIIWLCVPLSFIGVTAGLLITRSEFGFMALLGFLSLSGMLIKNAIVLVEQIDIEIEEGKPRYTAILDSCIGRMRPVMLAALTTVLGMVPLLFDPFFTAMSIVIMFGLTFATVLTLVVVPVLYAILFKIKDTETKAITSSA